MNKVTINGKTIQIPNGNVSIINGKIFVDGKEVSTKDTDLGDNNCKRINISIVGNVDRINCNGNVDVHGDVFKDVDCGGNIEITGDVEGDIDCGGNARITGDHKGSIDAGGSVSIR